MGEALIGLARLVREHKNGMERWLKKYNTVPFRYGVMDQKIRQRLLNYYLDDIVFLEQLWNTNLEEWKR